MIALCRMVLPGMHERGFGRIIALTSTVAREPDEGMALSSLARAGVLAYAKTLSREVACHGVTVNCILTGSVLTDRTQELLDHEAASMGVDPASFLEEAAAAVPTRTISSPASFAHAVVFLASPLASEINGVNLPIDGGFMRAL